MKVEIVFVKIISCVHYIKEVNLKATRTALAIGLISATLATDVEAKRNFRTGVYLGAEAGWLHDDVHFSEERTFIPVAAPDLTQKSSKDSDSFLPGIVVGYRHFMDCLFMGIEFGAYWNLSEAKSKVFVDTVGGAPGTANTKYKVEGDYNLIPRINFGRTFNDRWAVYGAVGVDFAQYDVKATETDPVTGARTNHKSKDKRYYRFLIGAGAEYAINCLWSARLDWTWSFAKKQGISMRHGTTGINDYHAHVRIASSALKFGIFAKF